MNCTVYPDKLHARIVGMASVVLLVGFWYIIRTHLPGSIIFQFVIILIGLVALGTVVASFVMGDGPYYRVDENGVFGRMPFKGTIPWSSVISVELLPRREQHGSETTFHLKEGWRPVLLTIREPDKYLREVQRWVRSVTPGGWKGEPARIRLEFTGLQPLSKEFHDAIKHRLARRDGKLRPAAGSWEQPSIMP